MQEKEINIPCLKSSLCKGLFDTEWHLTCGEFINLPAFHVNVIMTLRLTIQNTSHGTVGTLHQAKKSLAFRRFLYKHGA